MESCHGTCAVIEHVIGLVGAIHEHGREKGRHMGRALPPGNVYSMSRRSFIPRAALKHWRGGKWEEAYSVLT